jgi:ribosomal protein S1
MTVKMLSTSAVAALMLLGGSALAQQSAPPKVNCHVSNAKQKVEGQVMRINLATNIITIKESDGTVHEFQASKETLQDLKAGDHIEARLRPAENC